MDTSYHTPNSGGIGSGELLHELEEKMEVARVQLQLVDAISNMRRTPDVETSISKVNLSICNSAARQCQYNFSKMKNMLSSLPLYLQLNADLLDISQLYAEFAEPYNLWECQLAILHCAGHPDNMLIETVWNNIIEEEMAQTAELFPPDRIKVITNKIVALGKLYSSSQKYFPIGKSPNCSQ